jgi:hypothetical protein
LLRLSNARASSAGDLPGAGGQWSARRPTLVRRQPTPDDPTTTTDGGEQKPAETKPGRRNKATGLCQSDSHSSAVGGLNVNREALRRVLPEEPLFASRGRQGKSP